MASKLTLIDITSGFKGTDIQTNFTSIENEFDDTLSRSGKTPNTMNTELDMNTYKIRNLAQAANNSDAATLKDVLDQTTEDATSKPATAISVEDSGGYYSSDNVEGALQEFEDVSSHSSDIVSLFSDYSEEVVSLGNNFDADQDVRCARFGNWVTITSVGTLTHTSGSNAQSNTNAVPSVYRPSNAVENAFGTTGNDDEVRSVTIDTGGKITVEYLELSTGNFVSRTDTGQAFTVTYLIT